MSSVFHSWRRKVGVVTLVMACTVVAIWCQSYQVNDVALLAVGEQQHEFSSVEGLILWRSWRPVETRPTDAYERIPIAALKRVAAVKGADWLSRFDGSNALRISYWSLALPLSLLSAGLILWKPRKRASPALGGQHPR